MTHWIFNDIISFFVSLLIAGFMIPQILRVAHHKQLFDNKDARKIHEGVIPRLGGVSFFPAILFTFAIVLGFTLKYFAYDLPLNFMEELMPFCFLACAVLMMYLVGLADDLLGVRYIAKFIAQILASVLVVFSGIYIDNFEGLLWIHGVAPWIGWIVTGFMVVYVINSINLIDGIDGLASGLGTVAFIFYTIIFFFAGQYTFSLLAAAGAGTLMPFFYYNVFGDPNRRTKIFMGDTGSLTIGMLLVFSAIGMLHLGRMPVALDYNPVILGISPLLIPLLDAARVFINRMCRHQNPFLPDKTHIHHKLMALGFSQRVAMILIMVWAMFYIIINLFLSEYLNPTYIIIADIAVWIIVNLLISQSIKARGKTKTKKLKSDR